MRSPSLRPPTAGSDSTSVCIRAAAAAAAFGVEKSAIMASPMVFTTRPPCASTASRSICMQTAISSTARESPAVSYSRVLPVISANRTVV